jgi:hypothetical protein
MVSDAAAQRIGGQSGATAFVSYPSGGPVAWHAVSVRV